MKALILRSGSVPAQPWAGHGFPRFTLSVRETTVGFISGEKRSAASPRISLHWDVEGRRGATARIIRRALSDSDVIQSEIGERRLGRIGSRSLTSIVAGEGDEGGEGGSVVLKSKSSDTVNYACASLESEIPVKETGFSSTGGSGRGGGGDWHTTGYNGGSADRGEMDAYYQRMLKSNPGDFLLLRNYGRFLHEVGRDSARAEEYYGRAILASPGDGEVLSLYGKLVWETQRDEDRARGYFEQAVRASPDDCMVLGSYAHFMWEADEDDEEIEYGSNVPATKVGSY